MENRSDIRSALIDARLKNVDIFLHTVKTNLNNHHASDRTIVIGTWEYGLGDGIGYFAWRDGHWRSNDELSTRGPISLTQAFHYIDMNWNSRRKVP